MAELSTIARPYAEALFLAAQGQGEAGALDTYLAQLQELAAIVKHPQVAALIGDPKLTPQQIFDLLVGLLPQRPPGALQNFLRVVIENDRLAILPEVAAQFRRRKNAAEGAADCIIETAFPLDELQLAELVAGLSRKFGLKLKPAVRVDPELIGGVRVTVDDHVLDGTVKARLAEMYAALTAP
ncbi:MAG: F0F1 ATP synthase subunit delta [Sutterellaceae bacterium]|nr:F0F1 ATP synthase subunit delta [Burkholderiaceae bacterium]MCX7900901.1 F0F1 ATP synthase subunit delta [Burkholderiaceae bacterium]MDW8429741.1 F0F1 ATP synthase subunit delta [Sutterellaceae bacterium]